MIAPTTIALAELPSPPVEARRELPDTAAIYFVLAGDAVLYIGQSVSLRQRWLAHHRLAQLNERGACRIAWMTVDDASLLDELEQACIEHFSPILNNSPAADRGERVMVRLSPESANMVVSMAGNERRTISQMVRLLIEESIEARQRQRV